MAEGGQLPEDLSLELKLVVIFTRAIFIYANEEVYQEIVGLPMLQRSGISTDQSSYQSWLTNHETQAQGLIDCLKEDELSPEQEATIFVAQVHFLIFRKKFQQAVTALESAARLGSLYALHTLLDLHLTKLPDPAVGVNAWLNYKKPCESNLCRTRFEQHYDIGRKEPHELKALKYHKLALGMFETVRSGDCSIEKIHALTQPDVILGDKEPQILYSIRNLDNVYLFRGIAFMLAGKRQEAMETLNCIADHPCGRYLYAWLLNAEGSPLEDKKKAYTIFKELADTKYQAASQLQTAQCYMKELNFVEAKRYLSLAMAKFREKESYERLQVCQSLWAYLPDWVKQTHIEVPRLPEDQSAQRKQHPKSKIKKKLQQELQAVEISSPSAAKAPFPKDSVTSGRLSDDDSDGHVSDELDFVDDSEQLPEFLGLRNASSESPSVVTPTALVTRASVVSPSARPRAETTFSKEVHRDICAMIKRFEFDEAEQTLDTIDFNQESVINKAWHMQLRAWLIRCRWDQNEYGSEHAAKPRARKQQQIQFLEGALDHLKQGLKLFNIISVEALEKGFVDTNRLIADIGSDSDRHMVFILLSERARIHKCLDGLYVHNRQHKKYCDNLWKIAFAVSGTVRGHATAPRKQQPKISIISKEEFEYQKQSMQ